MLTSVSDRVTDSDKEANTTFVPYLNVFSFFVIHVDDIELRSQRHVEAALILPIHSSGRFFVALFQKAT